MGRAKGAKNKAKKSNVVAEIKHEIENDSGDMNSEDITRMESEDDTKQ